MHMEREIEEARKKVKVDLQLLREEALEERKRLPTEVEDTHQRLEEALQHRNN